MKCDVVETHSVADCGGPFGQDYRILRCLRCPRPEDQAAVADRMYENEGVVEWVEWVPDTGGLVYDPVLMLDPTWM